MKTKRALAGDIAWHQSGRGAQAGAVAAEPPKLTDGLYSDL